MRRIISCVLALVIILSLSACGGNETKYFAENNQIPMPNMESYEPGYEPTSYKAEFVGIPVTRYGYAPDTGLSLAEYRQFIENYKSLLAESGLTVLLWEEIAEYSAFVYYIISDDQVIGLLIATEIPIIDDEYGFHVLICDEPFEPN